MNKEGNIVENAAITILNEVEEHLLGLMPHERRDLLERLLTELESRLASSIDDELHFSEEQ